MSENRPVTLELAQRLAGALGQSPRYWLQLQLQFDMFKAVSESPEGVTPVAWSRRRAAG